MLFVDVRGFTTLIHERGSEEITPLIAEFFRRCSDIVAKYDGIIDHFRGDAIPDFFNVPIKHEDHVTRAVSVAQEIQQAVPDINLNQGQEDLLKVGVGITTGWGLTATVGTNLCKDYTVMGDVANIASRLQGLAGPGEIIVTEEVYEQVRSVFPNAEKQVLELRGISYPVVAYLLAQPSFD